MLLDKRNQFVWWTWFCSMDNDHRKECHILVIYINKTRLYCTLVEIIWWRRQWWLSIIITGIDAWLCVTIWFGLREFEWREEKVFLFDQNWAFRCFSWEMLFFQMALLFHKAFLLKKMIRFGNIFLKTNMHEPIV